MASSEVKPVLAKNGEKESYLMLFALLAGAFAARAFVIFALRGIGWEPDTYMHAIYCGTVFQDFPANIARAFEVWPKPLYTLIGGLLMTVSGKYDIRIIQLMNAVLWTGTGGVLYFLLRRLGVSPRARLFGLLIFFTCYLGLAYSVSAVTEPMFVALVVSAALAWYSGKPLLAAIAIGFGVWVRMEAGLLVFAFTILVILSKVSMRNKVVCVVFAWLPVTVWNLIGFIRTGSLFYLVTFGYSAGTGAHVHKRITHIFSTFITTETILFAGGLLAGTALLLIRKRRDWLIITIIPWLMMIVLTFLWSSFGFGTSGRNLLIVVPFAAALLAFSFDRLAELPRIPVMVIAGLLVFLQITITSHFLRCVGEWRYNVQVSPNPNRDLLDAGEWIMANYPADTIVACAHPAGLYAARRTFRYGRWSFGHFPQNETGLFIWEPEFSPGLFPLDRTATLELVKKFRYGAYVFKFTPETALKVEVRHLDSLSDVISKIYIPSSMRPGEDIRGMIYISGIPEKTVYRVPGGSATLLSGGTSIPVTVKTSYPTSDCSQIEFSFKSPGIGRYGAQLQVAGNIPGPDIEFVVEEAIPDSAVIEHFTGSFKFSIPERVACHRIAVPVRFTITNSGKSYWRTLGGPGAGQVRLGFDFLGPTGRVTNTVINRLAIPVDIAPGDTLEYSAYLIHPGSPGEWRIRIDPVSELVSWLKPLEARMVRVLVVE